MAGNSSTTLLKTRDVNRVRGALHGDYGELIVSLEAALRDALAGSEDATRTYVREYRQLTTCLLDATRGPDLVAQAGDKVILIELKTRALTTAIENDAATAPFSVWALKYDLGDGVALAAVDRLRMTLGTRSLVPPAGAAWEELLDEVKFDGAAVERFARRVRHFLNHPDDQDPLERLMEAYALSKTELGSLFGVSRQAIDGWLDKGVPSDRQEKLATWLAITDLLERKLKADRLPGVARREADVYGGQTMLDLIAADRHDELLGKVRDSFDWATPA